MHCLYVAFEMFYVFENKPLRLAQWVITLYLGVRISSFEVNPFNVIHHFCRSAKRAHPLFVALRFVSNTEWALTLATDEAENRSEETDLRGLFFENRGWRKGDAKSVS